MSYDILFVPRRPDQSWQDALDAAEREDALDVAVGPERMQQWDRIVVALKRRLGGLDVAVSEEACEASSDSGLQVSLFPEEAAVSFPYWEREDPGAFHDVVVDVVGLLERETGLSAWDAQTDAPFDGTVHDAPGLEESRRITPGDAVDGPDPTPAPMAAPAPAPARVVVEDSPQLAMERRRALRYVVLGAVIVTAALLWRAQGETSTLSGLAVAVGAADIAIGGLLWRSYRRNREQAS